MNASDSRQEYHLTPHGWTAGTLWSHGEIQGATVDRPTDAIESWEELIVQRTPYSDPVSVTRLLWATPDRSVIARDALRGRFRLPFAGFADNPFEPLSGDIVRTVTFPGDGAIWPNEE